MAFVSAAGPASNVLLAEMTLSADSLLSAYDVPLPQWLETILSAIITVNISLAAFNFLPLPPLDGFALAIGIQFLLIVFNAHWGTGLKDFPWNRQGGGWEYPLFWGLIWVAIGLRGGGPYSLDRKLGREL